MPSELALALCCGLVLFLLRLERRESAGVSLAVWIPTLWMLAISSKPVSVWFGVHGSNESGSVPDRLLLSGLAAIGIAVVLRRRFDWRRVLGQHRWLLVLLAYMCLSVLWSDAMSLSFKRWVRSALVVVMALVLLTEKDPRQALESVVRRSAYILLPFSLMLIKYYPSFGRDYGRWSGEEMWIGVTLQKNGLGRLCMVSSFFLIWVFIRRWQENPRSGAARSPEGKRARGLDVKWADAGVLLLALYLLRGAQNAYSATSIGTFVVGTATLLGLLWVQKLAFPLPRPALPVLLVLLIAFGTSAPFAGGANLGVARSALGRDETLTGRTGVWAELVEVSARQPLLGNGYSSFWTTERRENYQVSHGHNGYLDILLDLGAFGLVLYSAWLLACALKLRGALARDYDWGCLAICFLFMSAVYNTTESALNSMSEQMTAVLVLASIVVPYERTVACDRSHLRLRVHLPAKRDAGAAPAQPGLPGHSRDVRLLGRGGGQRQRRFRPGNGGQNADRGAF